MLTEFRSKMRHASTGSRHIGELSADGPEAVAESLLELRGDAGLEFLLADREGLDAVGINRVGDVHVHGAVRPAPHGEMAEESAIT